MTLEESVDGCLEQVRLLTSDRPRKEKRLNKVSENLSAYYSCRFIARRGMTAWVFLFMMVAELRGKNI